MSRRYLTLGLLFTAAVLVLAWGVMRIAGFTLIKTTRSGVPIANSLPSAMAQVSPEAGIPTNLIIVMGDGLGFSHLTAARAVNHGIRSPVSWDRFEAYGWHHAHPVEGLIIDSAASATALATGQETRYGAVGIGPGGESLDSLYDLGHNMGYRLGIVTDSYIWDATPAAFVTEVADRDDAASILEQLTASNLEILFGELEDVGEGAVPEKQETLDLLRQRFHLLDASLHGPPPPTPVALAMDEDDIGDLESRPNLPQMTTAALNRLQQGDRPFLLLVESEEADAASHDNDFERLLLGMAALEATLTVVLDFAQGDGSTLVLFTSDHESGGLALDISDSTNRNLKALWASVGHTAEPVPVMAFGPGSGNVAGVHTTAQLGQMLIQLMIDN